MTVASADVASQLLCGMHLQHLIVGLRTSLLKLFLILLLTSLACTFRQITCHSERFVQRANGTLYCVVF